MPQVGSRKRPAPGTLPMDRHHQQTVMTHNDSLPKFSDDQYLQWSAQPAASSIPTYPDPTGSFSPKLYNGTTQAQDFNAAINQVARRPISNMVTRGSSQKISNGPWQSTTSNNVTQVTEKAWQNDGSDLEQRAIAVEREARAKRKQIPPFVQKLSSFLDESRNTELIRWSDSGDSFIVVDEDEFARTLIPELFKHKNYASFVRQLNMYGFHKKVGLSDNSMRASERKAKPPSEYTNPFFKRGRPRLLWLIQKPKNEVRGTGKGRRTKQEDADFDDDGDETQDIDSPVPASQTISGSANNRNVRQPLMIGNAASASAPQDLDGIRQELANIRHQQSMISHAINKIRQNHQQLYGQAVAFQDQHAKHENSINAILTFLATVYNRSLDGGTGQNFANMFAGVLPPDAQASGNVVDVGDEGKADYTNGQIQQRFKKQQLLLKGPSESRNSRKTPGTPGSANPYLQPQGRDLSTLQNPQHQSYDPLYPGIQELADTPSSHSSQSPQILANNASSLQIPEADIISLINSTNADDHDNPPTARMDFPEALKHLQNYDGQSLLTSNQRNDVLRLMANGTDQNGIANAFTSPTPATGPDLSQYNATNDTLELLGKSLQEQDSKVANMERLLAPLSPSGSIPGFESSAGIPGQDMLDLDQIFNSGDYFDSVGETDFSNVNGLSNGMLTDDYTGDFDPNFDFDTAVGDGISIDGANNANANGDTAVYEDGGRMVETLNNSEAPSPANTVDEAEGGSLRKRRRKG